MGLGSFICKRTLSPVMGSGLQPCFRFRPRGCAWPAPTTRTAVFLWVTKRAVFFKAFLWCQALGTQGKELSMQATKLDFWVLMTNLSLKCYLILSFVGVVHYLVLGFSSSFCRKNNSIHVWGVFLSNSCSSPAGWWLSARVLPGTGSGRVPRAGRGSLGAWPRPCGGKGLASGWGCGHPV